MLVYNTTARRFERDGVPVTPEELRLLIDRLTLQTKREARRLSARLEKGDITREQWLAAMALLLKAAHIVGASVASGGIYRVENWNKVERKVRWQQGFLGKFAVAIAAGTVAAVAARAARYASAVYITFASAFMREQSRERPDILVRRELNAAESCPDCIDLEAQGFMPVDEMPEIGEGTQCGDFCKCTLDFDLQGEL